MRVKKQLSPAASEVCQLISTFAAVVSVTLFIVGMVFLAHREFLVAAILLVISLVCFTYLVLLHTLYKMHPDSDWDID